jgi:ribonuclease T
MLIKDRFRGFLPVVVDVETAGFNAQTDALLEVAAIIPKMEDNKLVLDEAYHFHIEPFKGANIEESALKFNGIKIDNPFRMAVSEKEALGELFKIITQEVKKQSCSKAILVGHNAFFDLGFLQSATKRTKVKSPFHQFSTFDTVSFCALALGETVLAKSVQKANIDWDNDEAHSALYDTQKTAELFCKIINETKMII